MPRADLLTDEDAWDCLVALPPGLGSLPACVRPGLDRRLSVPPTAAPATQPHRPPAGAEGERSPGICRPPPSWPSRPAAPPAAKHTDLPPHPGFTRLFKGGSPALPKAGFPGRTFPRRLPAGARVIAHLNKAATQVRANCGQPGRARASPCRTTNPDRGEPGKGEGKANKAGSRVWSRALCRTGGPTCPTPPTGVGVLHRAAPARCRPRPEFPCRPRAGTQPPCRPLPPYCRRDAVLYWK